MMAFRFGLVVTNDVFPAKAMIIAPYAGKKPIGSSNWVAMVLCDDDPREDDRWKVGEMITLSPENKHLRIVG